MKSLNRAIFNKNTLRAFRNFCRAVPGIWYCDDVISISTRFSRSTNWTDKIENATRGAHATRFDTTIIAKHQSKQPRTTHLQQKNKNATKASITLPLTISSQERAHSGLISCGNCPPPAAHTFELQLIFGRARLSGRIICEPNDMNCVPPTLGAWVVMWNPTSHIGKRKRFRLAPNRSFGRFSAWGVRVRRA